MQNLLILPISVAHWLLCFAASLAIMSTDLDRPRIALATAELLQVVLHVLLFPISLFTRTTAYAGSVHIPTFEPLLWALNSLLWSFALYYAGDRLYGWWIRQQRPAP